MEVELLESLRKTLNGYVPAAVKMPESVAVLPLLESVSPGGGFPVNDQEYGGVPPVATHGIESEAPTYVGVVRSLQSGRRFDPAPTD